MHNFYQPTILYEVFRSVIIWKSPLGPKQPAVELATMAFSHGIEQLVSAVKHAHLEPKLSNTEAVTPLPLMSSWRRA